MATIKANANGNWSAGATWVGGVPPSTGDVAVANGKTITIDTSVTCASIRNDTTGSSTAGGFFQPVNGITLTADVYAGDLVTASTCFRLSGTDSATINGTVYGNGYGPGSSSIAAATYGASNTGTGTLYVKATVQGALGMPAVNGPMQYISSTTASATVRATSGYTEITLRTMAYAGVLPAESDVKAGVVYGGGYYLGYLASSTTRATPMRMFTTMAISNPAGGTGGGTMPSTILLDETSVPLTADDDVYVLTED